MSWDYRAPLRDMRFVMEQVLQAPQGWQACPEWQELDADTASAILQEGARFAREVLLPLNASGDAQGCTREADGCVRTPQGFPAAYRAFVEGGWPALPCAPEWGGQGLPLLLDAAVREMLIACNQAWEMYPDLLHGAYETIKGHARPAQQDWCLAKLVSGEWLAAMALTEPQAGSDLGLLSTRAVPEASFEADGALRVTGDKIFISGGDHDLSDNIIHLVLCRLPDAPPGTRGISLALVPKLLPDGQPNTLSCTGLEHKMGIHGSATCAMRYEGAQGWLVGAPHKGLGAMFLMMNSARLHVGLQGLAHLEMAGQNALRYAFERLQMRAAIRPEGAKAAADPIALHPAMRHALLKVQALTEAQRVIAYRAAQCIDEGHHHPDATVRDRALKVAALLTPVVKAALTHNGFHGTSDALQVFGGYGFVVETGVEQSLRDARIAMIYEGTNEIQAIDLLQRKVLADGGLGLGLLLDDLDAEAQRCDAAPTLTAFAQALRQHTQQARAATAALMESTATAADPEAALRVADDYLWGLTHTLYAWAFAASARAALQEPDAAWAQAKTERMRYGVDWLLPMAQVHWHRVTAASLPLPALAQPE
ncbi:acyl-CoA dehydrogenase family protein [Ideonella sp.]|jgi:alkylation response protein AidB-like acyl-CoA dehydrogenase|uniref:acyl-CoA dehydrogenase family protein n=1 Tax=Ideonella sp. TaxID=1929293 RepID=UPI0037BF1668